MASSWQWACGANEMQVWDERGFGRCFADVVLLGTSDSVLLLFLLAWAAQLWRQAGEHVQHSSWGECSPLKQSWVQRTWSLEVLGGAIALCGASQAVLTGIFGETSDMPPRSYHGIVAGCLGAAVWLLVIVNIRINYNGSRMPFPTSMMMGWTLATSSAVVVLASTIIGTTFTIMDLPLAVSAALQVLFLGLAFAERGYGRALGGAHGSSINIPLLAARSAAPQDAAAGGPRGFWSRIGFLWVTPLLWRGSQRQLQQDDLFELEHDMDPALCSWVMWDVWNQERSHAAEATVKRGFIVKASLLRTLARAYGMQYLALGLIKLVNDLLNFAGPLLLNLLLRYLGDDDSWRDWLPSWAGSISDRDFGYLCAGLLGLSAVIKAVLNSQYSYSQGRLSCQLRSAITCAVFRKSLLLGSVGMSSFSTGAVQTMMSVDADRIVNLASGLHELWSLPMQIAIALYLLYTQVHYAFLAGLAVVLLLIPVNRWIALRIQKASEGMMTFKDARVRVLGEMLRGMYQIKLAAWEACFVERVEAARGGELQALSVRKYLDAWCVFFWAATSLLFSFFTFGLYVLLGNYLTASVVFTSLALFGVLLAPLNSFPWVVNGVVEALVSISRLQALLTAKEMDPDWAYGACPSHILSYPDSSLHAESFASDGSRAAGVSEERGSGSSGGSVAFNRRINRLSSGTSTPVMGLLQRGSRPGSTVSVGSTITAAPVLSSASFARNSADEMAAVVDEVMNEGASSGECSLTPRPPFTAGGPSSSGHSLSFGGRDPGPDVPVILVVAASFSWAADDTVREEQGPAIAEDAESMVAIDIMRMRPPLRDVAYEPISRHAWLEAQPVLRNIDFEAQRGSLSVIVGEVGSGKSSLLAAMLGEMQGCSGRAMVRGSVAYVGQQPWIMSGTVRENIVFGTPYQEARYQAAITACCLEPDLTAWPLGDLTAIGDRGATLSGGQRARLALARAVYQDADVYLLDDVLAAVDGHVSASLVDNVLCGNALGGKTRVVVTHAPACIARADTLVRMYRGEVAYCGPPENDALRSWELSNWLASTPPASTSVGPEQRGTLQPILSDGAGPQSAGAGAGPRRAKSDATPLSSSWGASTSGGLSKLLGERQQDLPVRREIQGDASTDIVPKVSVFAIAEEEEKSIREPLLQLSPSATGEPGEGVDAGPGLLVEEASCSGRGETREEGHVKWNVYIAYMLATGRFMTVVILSSLILMQATRNANDLFITYWATIDRDDAMRDPQHRYAAWWGFPVTGITLTKMGLAHPALFSSRSHYTLRNLSINSQRAIWSYAPPRIPAETLLFLAILCLIAVLNCAFTLMRAFSFAMGGLVAAQRLHEDLLTSVVRAPVDFFDKTPAGRILNRFSSDVATADDALPFTLNILLASIAQMLGLLAVLGFSQPWMLIAFIPLSLLYRRLQVYYQGSSREIRRLQSTTRSPVYATFSEVLDGGPSIRAFRQQSYFQQFNEAQMAELQKANMTGVAAAQWLSLRLQMMAAMLVSCIGFLAVLDQDDAVPPGASQEERTLTAAGLVGLSLSYALPLTGLLNQLLTTSAEMEQDMVAVERILEYTHLQSQALTLPPLKHAAAHQGEFGFGANAGLPASWPLEGCLILDEVWMRYSSDGSWALSGLTVSIEAGEKVGVCGRTGAGKSSLIAAILRVREISSGAVIMDGADLRTVPLPRLRTAIGVVPQMPFLFEGSVRDNLDPLRQHSDRELIGILKHVRLWDILCGLSLSQSKVVGRNEPSYGRSAPGARLRRTNSSSSGAVPPASPRSRRSPENSFHEGTSTPVASPSNRSTTLSRAVNIMDNPFAGRPPALPIGSPEIDNRLAAAEEGRPPSAGLLGGQPEILPDPSGPLSPASSHVGENPTSLAGFFGFRRYYDSLANESTGLLVNSGFGGQLLATRLGEGGVGLSVGQQQLLCLARVLLKRPTVVCLDECTANVDPNTATVMQQLIEAQLQRSTVIQVAHRLDSVLECDRVLVLERGRLVEQGQPRSLLRQTKSCFAAMYYAASGEEHHVSSGTD